MDVFARLGGELLEELALALGKRRPRLDDAHVLVAAAVEPKSISRTGPSGDSKEYDSKHITGSMR